MYWHGRDAKRNRGIKPTRVRKKGEGGAIANYIAKEVQAQVCATREYDYFEEVKKNGN